MKQNNSKKKIEVWRIAGSWLLTLFCLLFMIINLMGSGAPNFFPILIFAIFFTDAIQITTKYVIQQSDERIKRDYGLVNDGEEDNENVKFGESNSELLPWNSKKD